MASRAAAALLLLCWLHGLQGSSGACTNMTALSSQLDGLMAEYDREQPPGGGAGASGGAVLVQLALDVRHAAVSEYSASVRLLADLRMSWQDSRLAWNVSEWGCDSALAAAERLWLPDVALLNAATAVAGSGDAPLRARLASDGAVVWARRLDVSVPAALQLAAWPRDEHTAVFKFASRAYTLDEMDLIVKDMKYATVFEAGAWELTRLSSAVVSGATASGAGAGDERRVAAWTLQLRRRAPAHVLATGAVLAAALLLLLAAELQPPARRGPICAAAALVAALWLMAALARLPGGTGAPRAVALMSALCACGGAAALGAALVTRTARCSMPAPHALRALVQAAAALGPLQPAPLDLEGGGAGGPWAAVAALLDGALRAALALALLVLLCVYV